MRLVFVTQRVDPDDPVLGATVAKIAALASRFDEIVVVTDNAVAGSLPPNCRVRTFAARTRIGRGLLFTRVILSELRRRPRPVAVLAHMCPIYAVLAAPLVRPFGVRVLLWYAQWRGTRMLTLAARLSTDVISVDASTVPLESSKVVGIGHGIDVAQFPCRRGEAGRAAVRAAGARPLLALEGARGGPARGARSRATQGLDVRLRCHGPTTTPIERETLEQLERLVGELGLGDAVVLGGPVPRSDVPALLARSFALVNNTFSGAPDKVVFEACASCLPVLVSSPPLGALVDDLEPPLRFPPARRGRPCGRDRRPGEARRACLRRARRDAARAGRRLPCDGLLGRRGHGARDRASARGTDRLA